MQELKRLKRKIWWLRVKLLALIAFTVLTWWFVIVGLTTISQGKTEEAIFWALMAILFDRQRVSVETEKNDDD